MKHKRNDKNKETKEKLIELLESYKGMLKDELFDEKNFSNGRGDLYDHINSALIEKHHDEFEYKVIEELLYFIDNVLEGEYDS